MTDRVATQYAAYPYPKRDPGDEHRRRIVGSPSNLVEVDHYVFGGRRDWQAPFRALIAGGDTGDAAIMLAQQLADAGIPAALLHHDISATRSGDRPQPRQGAGPGKPHLRRRSATRHR